MKAVKDSQNKYKIQRTASGITGTFYRVPVYSNSTATTLAGYIFFRNEPYKMATATGTIVGSTFIYPSLLYTPSGYFSSTDTLDPTAELQSFTITKPQTSKGDSGIGTAYPICTCRDYYIKSTFFYYNINPSTGGFTYRYELTLNYTTVTYPDYTYKVPYVGTFVDTSTTLQVACSNPSATVTNNYGTQKVGKPVGTEIEELECTGVTTGLNWIESTLPSSVYWTSVTYGNGKFVAVADGSSQIAYSTDGITWTKATLPSSASWLSVTYGNGKFVAVDYGTSSAPSNKAAYSTDGITWTESTLPSSANWYSVTYGNGKFVAVAYYSNKAAYSTDGITWTASTLPYSDDWASVTYGDGKFVAVAEDSNTAAYSTNGITWRASTLPSDDYWTSVIYGNGKFVAVGGGLRKAAYSTDGITWRANTLPSSAEWQSVTYGDGKFVVVAYGSNKAAYSTDGITWTASTLPSSDYWQSATYGDGKFVAVAWKSNKVAYSPSQIITYKDTTTQQPKALPTGVSIGNIQVGDTVTNTYTTTGNYYYGYKAIRS